MVEKCFVFSWREFAVCKKCWEGVIKVVMNRGYTHYTRFKREILSYF